MTDETRREPDDALMEWALRERVGGEAPPDLTAAVRARLDTGGLAAAAAPARRRALAVAAVVLVSTCVVVAISQLRHRPAAVTTAPPQQPVQEPARVNSREQIDALLPLTRHVICTGITDDELPGLLRLRHLDTLQLNAIWPSPIAPGQPLRPMHTLTDDGLRLLCSLKSLRVLHLDNQTQIGAPGLEALARLPNLTELSLLFSVADEDALAALSRLPRLTVLRLAHCTKVGEATIERIAAMTNLRSLDLSGCGQIETHWLRPLANMQGLERLDLGMIGSRTYFSGFAPVDLPEPGSGITDDLLAVIAAMKALRVLDLSYGEVSGAGLEKLRDLQLAEIDLTGIELPIEDLAVLPATLTTLSLRGRNSIGAGLGATLAAATPELTMLNLSSCRDLEAGSLAGLQALDKLRHLDVSYCADVTARVIEELTRLQSLTTLELRGWQLPEAELLDELRAMPNLARLVTDAGEERLR